MGMDGLSIANTGAIKEQTSAEYTNRVEQSMASDPTNSAQQVQSLTNNKRVKEKEEGEESNSRHGRGANPQAEFEDGLVEEKPEEELSNFDVEDFENPDREFYVKLNVKDDIIELYDSSSDRLIETITGDELGQLVQKLNMASGIFVNKKV